MSIPYFDHVIKWSPSIFIRSRCCLCTKRNSLLVGCHGVWINGCETFKTTKTKPTTLVSVVLEIVMLHLNYTFLLAK